ncbi:MAG TPA: YihY/virulence factor BrkB family protein [Actinomycetota bacterium]|nr:YihY/virulence factor BrkB family protein [Actinomycetota bacterium]
MRTVVTVPETQDQDAGDARDQLRRSGTLRLFRDAAVRLRAAHGTTYARALGHSSLLTLIPGVIAVIGLIAVFDLDGFARVLEDAVASFAPGSAGGILTQALESAAPSAGPSALVVGLAGMLFSGTVGMTHLERAADRIYGVEEDRSPRERLGLALVLAATVEVMLMIGLAVIVAGGKIGEGSDGGAGSGLWSFVRWPVGVGLVALAMTIIFRLVPNRHQPQFSWLLSGTTVSVTAWVAATILLGLVYEHASLLGDAFGPLIGVVALLVWAYATGLAVLFGLAFAAQLEAERASQRSRAGDEASR